MFEFQSHLIFPVHAVPDAGALPPGAKSMSATSADGQVLRGVHIPPDNGKSSRVLILGFGGNAWNGQDVAEYLHELFPDEHVVVFHYRGYPPSSGSPSAEALLADAPIVYDAAVERVRPDEVIAVGFSIGTGVAATLAGKRELGGLILVTPFDSLRAVAASMYPWLPIGPFFAHEIDAVAPLRHAPVPVAVIAAEEDEIVPAERTDALRKALPDLVLDRTIKDAGHNDIYTRSDFKDAMWKALSKILKAGSSGP